MTTSNSYKIRMSAIGAAIIALWTSAGVLLILNTFVFRPPSEIVEQWIYSLDIAALAASFGWSMYRLGVLCTRNRTAAHPASGVDSANRGLRSVGDPE